MTLTCDTSLKQSFGQTIEWPYSVGPLPCLMQQAAYFGIWMDGTLAYIGELNMMKEPYFISPPCVHSMNTIPNCYHKCLFTM